MLFLADTQVSPLLSGEYMEALILIVFMVGMGVGKKMRDAFDD